MCLNTLIVFTKYPQPGLVKTRLIPFLGNEKSALLHRKMTERTIQTAKAFTQKEGICLRIFYTGGSEDLMRDWLGEMDFVKQKGEDIGEKMAKALNLCLSRSDSNVVLIGTDCPGLRQDILHNAFLKLENNDLVLGPAADGGYYLVGVRKKVDFLFGNISWGTDKVFSETEERALENKVKMGKVETLHDVDRPDDLPMLADLLSDFQLDFPEKKE